MSSPPAGFRLRRAEGTLLVRKVSDVATEAFHLISKRVSCAFRMALEVFPASSNAADEFGTANSVVSRLGVFALVTPNNAALVERFAHALLCTQDPGLKRRLNKRAGQVKVKGKPDMTTWWLLTDENLRDG